MCEFYIFYVSLEHDASVPSMAVHSRIIVRQFSESSMALAVRGISDIFFGSMYWSGMQDKDSCSTIVSRILSKLIQRPAYLLHVSVDKGWPSASMASRSQQADSSSITNNLPADWLILRVYCIAQE